MHISGRKYECRVFNKNFSRRQNLRSMRKMDNAHRRRAFREPKAWACRGVQGNPPSRKILKFGLLECISCSLEHDVGHLNTALILLNFGFFIQRGNMNSLNFWNSVSDGKTYFGFWKDTKTTWHSPLQGSFAFCRAAYNVFHWSWPKRPFANVVLSRFY